MDNQTIQFFIVCYRGKWVKIPVREPITETSFSTAPLTKKVYKNIESMELLELSILPIKELKKKFKKNEMELNWINPQETKKISRTKLIQGSSRRSSKKRKCKPF